MSSAFVGVVASFVAFPVPLAVLPVFVLAFVVAPLLPVAPFPLLPFVLFPVVPFPLLPFVLFPVVPFVVAVVSSAPLPLFASVSAFSGLLLDGVSVLACSVTWLPSTAFVAPA